MPAMASRSERRARFACRTALLVLVLVTSLAAVGAGCRTSRGDDMSTLTVTQADDGRTVDLGIGQTLILSLEENRTTGYRWTIEGQGEVLALRDSRFEAPSDAGVGAGGRHLFELAARRSGRAVIDAKLWREWEGDASTIERFTLTVQVE